MCLKRKPPPNCGIKTNEVQTKIRLVPIDKLHAAEAQTLKKSKMVQRMAKLLKIGVKSGAMTNDWTRMANSLIEQTDSVNPEVLVIEPDEVDGIKNERMEYL